MFSSSIFLATLAVGAVSHPYVGDTILGFAPAPLTKRNSLVSLDRRQAGGSGNDFPPQCSTQCAATESALASCSDDQCFCTANNMINLKTCLQCVGNLDGDIPTEQTLLNAVTGNCTSEGFSVPSETLTGGAAGGGGGATSSAVKQTATGTQTGSSPTPTGSGNFPPQCSNQCAATNSALASCSNDACFCTATNIGNLATCLQCSGDVTGDINAAQVVLNEVIGNCTAEGFSVPSETLSGATVATTSGGFFSTSATGTKPVFTSATPLSSSTSTTAGQQTTSSSPLFGAASSLSANAVARISGLMTLFGVAFGVLL